MTLFSKESDRQSLHFFHRNVEAALHSDCKLFYGDAQLGGGGLTEREQENCRDGLEGRSASPQPL